jgi:subtilisin family serine protease
MRLIIGGLLIVIVAVIPVAPAQPQFFPPAAPDDRLTVVLLLHHPAVADPLPGVATTDPPQLLDPALARRRHAMVQAEQQRARVQLAALLPEAQLLYGVRRVYNGLAVRVSPADLLVLAAAPWVRSVLPLTPKYLSHRTSVPLIGAPQLWAASGLGLTGRGVKIGIIDTGIDYAHATFGGTGALQPPNFGPGKKVAGGYDFAGDAYTGFNEPTPDADPRDCNGHGSHVAGTAAGYGVTAAGVTYTGGYTDVPTDLAIGPGVAPEAELYALRIFGCNALGTLLTDQAIDWAIDPNGDGDLSDRLDVINLSLGIDFGSPTDSTTLAAQRAVAAGVIVVAAATNAGDSTFAVGSPAVADGAIAVAGSADAGAQADGFRVDAPPALAGVYPGNAATFNWAGLPGATLSAPLAESPDQRDGCTPFTGASATVISGTIALLDWGTGTCPALTRVNNAAAAGARGVLLVDSADLLTLRPFGTVPIPTLAIPRPVGVDLRAALVTTPITVTLAQAYNSNVLLIELAREDTLYADSARGPRRGDSLLKPDLAAPATTISSAAVGTASGRRELSGTSMAAPHVAGAAALLRQLHPDWSVEQIKALLMNSANADLYSGLDRTGLRYGPARVGAGRLNLLGAAATETLAYSADRPGFVSVAFGAVDVITGTTVVRTHQVRVSNQSAAAQRFDLRIEPRVTTPGVGVRVAPADLNLNGGASTLVTVTLTADPAAMDSAPCDPTIAPTQAGNPRTCMSEASALLLITPEGAPEAAIRLPIHAVPHLAAATRGPAEVALPALFQGATALTLTGSGLATAQRTSLVSVLELQALRPRTPSVAAAADIRAIGVHSDYAGGERGGTRVSFGIATHGDWSATGSPIDTWFEVWIDVDGSGVGDDGSGAEFTLRNVTGPRGSEDVRTTVLINNRTGRSVTTGPLNLFAPDEYDPAVFNTRVVLLGVTAADLGLEANPRRLRYRVASFNDLSYSGATYVAQSVSTELSYDPFQPGLRTPGALRGPIHRDQAGSIALSVDQGALNANGVQSVLLLHHHHSGAARVEIIPFGEDNLERLYLPVMNGG